MTMKKIEPGDPMTQSADVKAENIEQLKALFPELVTEGPQGTAINVDVLKALVGDATVTDAEEKYGLNWHGKRLARQIALTPSTGTLRPCREESVDWDTTRNLMIEGDNLEVLKLLQKSYAGKVKMIYIDPPYNTGKDFVYPDDFRDNIRNYLELTGQTDGEGRRVTSNTEASGRFHTDWLNMMYPRLRLARNLLRDDGVIFISLDDTEVANARSVCDDIFGAENFVANIVWQKKYAVSNDDPGIGVMHDHIIAYRKSETFKRGLLPRTKEQNDRYSNPDNDPRGEWASDNYVSNKSKDERPTLWYSIKHPRTGEEVWPEEHAVWRYTKDKHDQLEREGRLYWGPDHSYRKPRLKRYLNEVQQGIVPPTWWKFEDSGHNDEGQKETAKLIGKKVFSTPKPIRLLERLLEVGAPDGGIVVDFFAGSGAFGHAAISRNSKISADSLKYVLVQLPEPIDGSSSDQKVPAAFCDSINRPHNISEITKERLRRAGKKIKEKNPLFAGDTGFRVFKLDTSNIRPWQPDRDDLEKTLFNHQEHLVEGRSEQDILFELLLKLGLDLTVPMEQRAFAGKTVHSIGLGALMVCLAEQIKRADVEPLAQGILDWWRELAPAVPVQFVFRDSGFADDVAKTNLAAILEQNIPSDQLAGIRSL
ncbi:Site-specific DNA-methyltransferase (adenine-specific) [Magnetococcus marinus MC-1]|uniref:site-specific DNA-methyltransferase (adenine-specific) n=1 Tax=Magnetococcus marinus (strain ATCC BAA-1437 / JCM 17883 / MC-1) TaxID=156889 RepID=A0L5R5_MAGMM|nr:site-specific DNA-methyltransferase [Magnetococcus marinus]ABK43308.1 Site-specific DNA-methyltransferase (adenine-specific) [Magnetococcus marinus MC-1]